MAKPKTPGDFQGEVQGPGVLRVIERTKDSVGNNSILAGFFRVNNGTRVRMRDF
jgi:hypothetical protein